MGYDLPTETMNHFTLLFDMLRTFVAIPFYTTAFVLAILSAAFEWVGDKIDVDLAPVDEDHI